jgi:hypothetical protein
MQSIFSLAARRKYSAEHLAGARRDGELKMDRTKPPWDARAYGDW